MTKTLYIKKYKIMNDLLSQIKGLMFSKKIKVPLIFVFKKDVKLLFHSAFCPKFDIVFLDKNKRTVYTEEVRKMKIIKPKNYYRYVIEAAPGFIKQNRIRKKTKINF